jgi:hypothetical protein
VSVHGRFTVRRWSWPSTRRDYPVTLPTASVPLVLLPTGTRSDDAMRQPGTPARASCGDYRGDI